jgi:LuxR family transcriptional regulator, maltose regulon positive regulatory protein
MRLRPQLTAALPYRAVQTRLELVRAHLAVTDVAGARTLLREAWCILQQRPHLGILSSQTALLQSRLDSLLETTTGAATLTNAELRLLPLLATHLTFREMGERLYLSPHTVKSQALSVYRKLGVSSRGQAIRRVQQTGLVGAR